MCRLKKRSMPSMPKVRAKAEEEKEEAESVLVAVKKGMFTEIAPRTPIKEIRASDNIKVLDVEAKAPTTMAARHPPGTKVPSDRRSSSSSTAKVGINNSSRIGISSSSSTRAAGRARAQVTFTS